MPITKLPKKAPFIAGVQIQGLEKIRSGKWVWKILEEKFDNVIPLFDQYNAGFNAWGRFNRVLHGKSWTHRQLGDHKVYLNYIFSCALINIYHLWINAGTKKEIRNETNWLQFCIELAYEMIK